VAFSNKEMLMSPLNTLPPVTDFVIANTKPVRKLGRTPKHFELLQLASAAGGFETKKAARDALKAGGFISTESVVESLRDAAHHITSERKTRRNRAIKRRLGYVPSPMPAMQATKPVLLPRGTPTARVSAAKVQAVAARARSLLRYGAAGGHVMRVAFALNASEVGYVVNMNTNWDTYKGAYKGWAASEDHHLITVPEDWRLRVERKGLASLGGMMTLDAHPLIPDGDVRLYAATWARQGRGYSVTVDRGYIAVLDDEHFHAESAEAAIKGVRRKVKSAEAPLRNSVSPYDLSIEGFITRYKGRNLSVSVSDAEDSGSCDFGIRSWCEFVGLDYSSGAAPLSLVLEGFRKRPQEEVRRAVVHAVRRHRAHRKTCSI
jgi:hypothetical protein